MKKIDEFWAEVESGGALGDAMDALMKQADAVPAGEIVSLAADHGFSFTVDELRSFLESTTTGELSDEELERVAGGAAFVKYDGIDGESLKLQPTASDLRFELKSLTPGRGGIISF